MISEIIINVVVGCMLTLLVSFLVIVTTIMISFQWNEKGKDGFAWLALFLLSMLWLLVIGIFLKICGL